MTSAINTNSINTNYPIPGKNNPTQGFRDNFTAIKTNLDTAGNEITDLQNKAVLKSALANTTLNNDMANTLISNASTLGFRATTYNLGNALTGPVLVNCQLGDVQYGNLAGNVVLNFGNWAPTNTQSKIQLQIGRANSDVNYSISFPSAAIADENHGFVLLENYSSPNNVSTISFPYDVTQLNLTITSNDCGNSLFVEPTNRPFVSTQVQQRTPLPTGFLGDVAGAVAVDSNYFYVCTGNYDATTILGSALTTTTGTNVVTFSTNIQSAGVVANMPVIFDTMFINGNSVSSFGNINSGQFYYVKTVNNTEITISDSRTGGVAGATLALTTVSANSSTSMDATFYDGSDIWKRVSLTLW